MPESQLLKLVEKEFKLHNFVIKSLLKYLYCFLSRNYRWWHRWNIGMGLNNLYLYIYLYLFNV